MESLSKSLSTLDTATIWHGNHSENDNQIVLLAGNLSMIYENGNLRYLTKGKNELIRMIYPAVRDKEWLTIKPLISKEKFDIKTDSFRVEYECLYRSGEIDFSARYRIEGHSDSNLIFSFTGVALKTFEKCRIGFCILHPIEGCSGKPCLITHGSGLSETIPFPVHISPDEIFTDIVSMKWNASGAECILNFTGDLFETEDQRNWTDASYKTYCTPQNMPCPSTIRKGEEISQKVEFILSGKDIQARSEVSDINVTIDRLHSFEMPRIGTGRSTRPESIDEREAAILKDLGFDHYRADLYLFNPDWKEQADMAVSEADNLGFSLELALFFDEYFHEQVESFTNWLTFKMPDKMPEISVISLFHKEEAVTSDHLINVAAPRLQGILPGVRTGCGTNANFAQLNRKVPQSPHAGLLCYSVHPQEHASDNTTLVENIRGQAFTVESAIQFAEGKGIWISPVNLQRRFNANIENYETPVTGNAFPPQADTRIMSLFGACWTAGCLKYLGESGVQGITFFETAGERGIIQGDHDSRWPEHFMTVKGMIFPVYHLFRWVLRDKTFRFIKSVSTVPLEVESLALSDGRQIRLCLVNFTSMEKKMRVSGFSGETKIKSLNAGTYIDAASDPEWIEKSWENIVVEAEEIVLNPYSLAFIEEIM